MNWIVFPSDDSDHPDLGGKARALAELSHAGLPIPAWFVVRGEACLHSLGEESRRQLAEANDPAAFQKLFAPVAPERGLAEQIHQAVAKLNSESLAVRSSASDEDGPEHSFAGQLESYLSVPPSRVAEKVAAVWRSGFAKRILNYRRHHGLSLAPRAPAVLIQRMVEAETAGVAFSADPVSGRRGVAVVSAVYGLGTTLVSGEANADTWFVDRSGVIIERRIAAKEIAHRSDPNSTEGYRTDSVPAERARQPALNDDQVRAVAALARRCAAHFGRPEDIEWAFEQGHLFLLQCRPITSLAGRADPEGALNIWDNSNIAESYGGITTPLTFSFARKAYEEVYRQFCRLMAVPPDRIADQADVFRCMLGLVRGRVYYNLLNWYRLLALLPGFTVNRPFMEQMMGVKEGLPETLLRGLQNASAADRLKDAVRLAFSIGGLVVNHFTLRSRITEFYHRLSQALGPPQPPLDQARPDELVTYYRGLEHQLLTRWDAPLINDFFAMIFYGLLRKFSADWCADQQGTLQNDLLCGEGGMISAEPARRVRQLARIAAQNPSFASMLCSAPLPQVQREMDRFPEFAASCRKYLEEFGDRCLEELKLESPTLHDNPTLLFRSIGHLACHPNTEPAHAPGLETTLRAQGAARAAAALRNRPLRRLIFGWVLKHARARVRDRENLRFERTRLFGRVRRVFVALGRELHARGLLDAPADIFYLEVEEILGFCDGTTTTADLKELVKLRRAEFSRYAAMEPPADRFETHGPVHHAQDYRPHLAAAGADQQGPALEWKGIGCCPGTVRGPVRVVHDPRQATLKPGEILVAERTDPGWIMLFASAAGLIVERGSLLSHSAIVSREMGIPSVVSIPGITGRLKDGDCVELNGATGIVKRC